jgi:hypothetical protein
VWVRQIRVLLNAWPVAVLLALFPLQTELLIASAPAWAPKLGMGRVAAFWVIAAIGTAKLYWGYWFWRWVMGLIADTGRFHRLAVVVRQAASVVRAEGFADRFLAELQLRHTPDEWRKHPAVAAARRAGYVALFGIGAAPMYGARGPLGPVLAAAHWRDGVTAMALGNAVRIAYLMGGVELFRHLAAAAPY